MQKPSKKIYSEVSIWFADFTVLLFTMRLLLKSVMHLPTLTMVNSTTGLPSSLYNMFSKVSSLPETHAIHMLTAMSLALPQAIQSILGFAASGQHAWDSMYNDWRPAGPDDCMTTRNLVQHSR